MKTLKLLSASVLVIASLLVAGCATSQKTSPTTGTHQHGPEKGKYSMQNSQMSR